MKVLYVASEALPFMASGGLGDVAGSLPQALRKRLIGCRDFFFFMVQHPYRNAGKPTRGRVSADGL